MEAAGRIRVDIEAKLSRGPSIPVLRRQVSNDRWHEVGISVSSGNFISAKVIQTLGRLSISYTDVEFFPCCGYICNIFSPQWASCLRTLSALFCKSEHRGYQQGLVVALHWWEELLSLLQSYWFYVLQPRGVVNGIDFGATGEVKKIDVVRIKERLDSNCIVMLSNLGYSSSGQVLNCKYVHKEVVICWLLIIIVYTCVMSFGCWMLLAERCHLCLQTSPHSL